jgi:ankyrin repeat protein
MMKNRLIDIDLDMFYTQTGEYEKKTYTTIIENEIINKEEQHQKLIDLIVVENIEEIKKFLNNLDNIEYINYHKNDNNCLNTSLYNGNIEICELLLKYGADINYKDNSGYYPIHRVALSKNIYLLDLLIKYGADINQQDDNGNTLLHLAIIINNKDLIKKILYYNPDLTIKNTLLLTSLECTNDDKILEIFNIHKINK